METKDIVLLAVTLIILGEVSYLLAKLPKTNIKAKDRAILVDTSVLMDGRITALAATGFMGGTLVVPRSVVGELQFLADNADADKRARARHGLDIVSELQHMEGVEVELLQDGSRADEGVDERLLTLAKQHNAVICTLDYNLNKVAAVENIKVLNINELAQALRMAHLPGEELMIELVQKGQDSHQAVGYLPDGTMVVVEQAKNYIGQAVRVEIVRSLQTAAGKMMFAKRVGVKPVASMQTPPQKAATSGRKPAPQKPAVKPAQASGQKTAAADKRQQPQQRAQKSERPERQAQPPKQHSYRRAYHARPKRSADREAALMDLVDRQP